MAEGVIVGQPLKIKKLNKKFDNIKHILKI